MPNTDKNKSGGHSHPQHDSKNQSHNQQGDSRKSSSPHDRDTGKKGDGPKESFGSSGAKDSH